MDPELTELRALEAEIAALRRACAAPSALGDAATRVRYVALPRPAEGEGAGGEGLSPWAFRTSAPTSLQPQVPERSPASVRPSAPL